LTWTKALRGFAGASYVVPRLIASAELAR